MSHQPGCMCRVQGGFYFIFFPKSSLLIPVLAPQTTNTLLEAVSSSSDAVRFVQIGVVRGCDVCVLAVVAGDSCWITVVEHTLAFLLLVFFPQGRRVLHLNSTVIVDLVSAKCAVECEGVALAFDIIWVVVLEWSSVLVYAQKVMLNFTIVPFLTTACILGHH